MKYVLVTGGVVSGLGKGVTASSTGVLLQARGLRVTSIKIGKDPGSLTGGFSRHPRCNAAADASCASRAALPSHGFLTCL